MTIRLSNSGRSIGYFSYRWCFIKIFPKKMVDRSSKYCKKKLDACIFAKYFKYSGMILNTKLVDCYRRVIKYGMSVCIWSANSSGNKVPCEFVMRYATGSSLLGRSTTDYIFFSSRLILASIDCGFMLTSSYTRPKFCGCMCLCKDICLYCKINKLTKRNAMDGCEHVSSYFSDLWQAKLLSGGVGK